MIPFQRTGTYIYIKKDHLELLCDSLDSYSDLERIADTDRNYNKILFSYRRSFWMDRWYHSSIAYTPRSKEVSLQALKTMTFDSPQFVRLNSLSPKHRKPVSSGKEAYEIIVQSSRCKEVMAECIQFQERTTVFLRDFHSMDTGNEYRCFVFNNGLTAIGSHDDKWVTMEDSMIRCRCQSILSKCLSDDILPFKNCIMDVYLDDYDECRDILVEFNSFGSWASAGPGLFSWEEDIAQIYGLTGFVEVRSNRINGL